MEFILLFNNNYYIKKVLKIINKGGDLMLYGISLSNQNYNPYSFTNIPENYTNENINNKSNQSFSERHAKITEKIRLQSKRIFLVRVPRFELGAS